LPPIRFVGLLCIACAVTADAGGQHTSSFPRSQTFGAGTTAIVVDVVVRDGQGNPVTDLGRDDFQLLEDGVGQVIGDVRIVAPANDAASASTPGERPAALAGSDAPPSSRDTSRDTLHDTTAAAPPTFVALVFDRLSPEGRALAHKGALAYLESSHENDFAGVFLSDLILQTVQTYTTDRVKLRRAIDEVATRATSIFDRQATRPIDIASPGDAHASVPVVASADTAGRPVDASASTSRADAAVAAAMTAGQHSWELLARDQQGFATTNALMALATGLGALPGRKTIVFFAEGLAIPDAVLPHFRNVVATANRANVSVYTIDAAGLRVHSTDAATGREVRAIGDAQLKVNADGSTQSNLGLLERNEDVLRKDPRTSLTLLARQTGGFLVENTNDLARAFRTIDADRRFHYLLTYTPSRTDFDGEWRTIEVRVPGRAVEVRSRTGYMAVRTPGTLPLLTHEGPALADLDRVPPPADVPLGAAALVFPRPAADAQIPVLLATSARGVTFETTPQGYRTEFTMLARITDVTGETVRKGSQLYRLTGPADQLERARGGTVIFYRQPSLPAGEYTLEAVVHDGLGRRAGVSRVPFAVPSTAAGTLAMSSLVIVERAERLQPGERDPGNPLHLGEVLLSPNLGAPLRKRPDAKLAFFFTVLAPPGGEPKASLQLLQAGRMVADLPLTLPPPDADGRRQSLAQLPLATLAPGDYVLRVTVTHADQWQVREATFTVSEYRDGSGL
jgi:VWFA-related protein